MRRLEHGDRGRRPPRSRRWGPIKAALGVGFFALALGGPAWLWQSGLLPGYAGQARKAAFAASADLGLIVREVRVRGNRHVPKETILAAAAIDVGAPIFAFDPAAVRHRLERMAWVETAVVSRLLPGTAVIDVHERKPFAIWQRDGNLYLIDSAGIIITTRNLYRFAGLPLIVGARTPQKAKSLLASLAAEPDLGKRVEAVIRVGERRWDVRLDNGIDVRLPERDEHGAWRTLARLDRRHALLARRISAIDLRIPGRVVVTSKDAPDEDEDPQGGQD